LFRVRNLLYGTATLALAMVTSPDAIRAALAATASSLFEATPFLFAGIAVSHLLRGRCHAVEYLGCGCGGGPSARSLPAAAAAWLVFGPAVAVGRPLAASLVAWLLRRRIARSDGAPDASPDPLRELAAVVPAAALAGTALQLFGTLDPARLSPIGNAFLGAGLGFVAAPCGLGAIALAGALRVHAPMAAAAFLCVAGVVDLRALSRRSSHAAPEHDAFAYTLLAAALGIVAWRRGDALVHPALALALGCCASAALICAVVYRQRRSSAVRIAPGLMLIGALAGAPMPQYRATETTLTDLFAGERLTFTGALARQGGAAALVRYAITCCRADAAPIAIRLNRPPPYATGTWLRVDGRIVSIEGDLRLVPQSIERIAAPADPFIYN
jgi:hypothetical protein